MPSHFSARTDAALPEGERDPLNRALRDLSQDRKSTRLNSSHSQISYAVFCLKKKKKTKQKGEEQMKADTRRYQQKEAHKLSQQTANVCNVKVYALMGTYRVRAILVQRVFRHS